MKYRITISKISPHSESNDTEVFRHITEAVDIQDILIAINSINSTTKNKSNTVTHRNPITGVISTTEYK